LGETEHLNHNNYQKIETKYMMMMIEEKPLSFTRNKLTKTTPSKQDINPITFKNTEQRNFSPETRKTAASVGDGRRVEISVVVEVLFTKIKRVLDFLLVVLEWFYKLADIQVQTTTSFLKSAFFHSVS
jgi:hypothetical protein